MKIFRTWLSGNWIKCMKEVFFLQVCNRGFLRCSVQTKIFILSVYTYFSSPFVGVFMEINTKESGFIIAMLSSILSVFSVCCLAEIRKLVVTPIKVAVIKHINRPLPEGVEPCESMTKVQGTVNSDLYIACPIPTTSFITFLGAFISYKAGKTPRLWIIVKQFAQVFCSKIGLSHAVAPFKQWFGQKPRRVISTSGLCYFSALQERCLS